MVDAMRYVFRSTGAAARGRNFVQRAEDDGQSTMANPAPAAPGIDVEELVERVYRRWQDELRRERERGAW
jgi:hypothetical protein